MANNVAIADNGVQLDFDTLPVTVNYTGTLVSSLVVENYNDFSYTQTFTNDGTNITGWSVWVSLAL